MSEKTNFSIPEINSFESMLSAIKKKIEEKGKPRAALVLPHESEMISSFARAVHEDLIEPYVVGDEKIYRSSESAKILDPDKINFIDIAEPEMAVITAAQMGARDEIDLICKGRISAEKFLNLSLSKETQFVKRGQAVNHIFAFKPDSYFKLLFVTDAAIIADYSLKNMISAINNLVSYTNHLKIHQPRAAILAAVEVVYPQMESTIKGAALAVMALRKQIKSVKIDGPLSFDVAIDIEAAIGKGVVNSEVAGQADLLIAPDIDTANGIYKAMTLYGQASCGAVVFGGAVPITASAYCDSEETRFNSILMAILGSF